MIMPISSTDNEERAVRQRRFFLNLFPLGGSIVASNSGGFIAPGPDSQEAELRDAMTLWLQMQHSGAGDSVADTAWWMTRFMDPHGRKNKTETDIRHNELTSFAVAAIGELLASGTIDFVNQPEIPVLVTQDQGLIDDVDQGVLDRLEASLKKDGKNE